MKRVGTPVLASTFKNNRGGNVFNAAGELNASSKKDALQQIAAVLAATAQGQHLLTEEEVTAAATTAKQRREVLSAVINDKSGETAMAIGAEMAGTINMNLSRMGFARQLLEYQELEQGQRPEIYLQDKNVTAAIMTGPTQAQLQFVRDPVLFPKEVEITARLVIEQAVINTSREDILNRKYNEGLETILVKEDSMFISGVDTLIDATGQYSLHASANITPEVFEAGISMITGFNMPLAAILFSTNLYANFITNRDFETLIEPVTRLEILRTGNLGTLYGAAVMTDGTREPTQKVLSGNDIYFFSTPEYVGEYTDRGGVQSVPLTVAETGINGAGWHMAESISMASVNHRAVARTRLV